MNAPPAVNDARISGGRLTAFVALAMPTSALMVPLGVYLPAFYAQELGIGMAVLGTLFMLSRFWDTFVDPLVGILSDRTRSRFGRRGSWIIVGSPLMLLATYMLFLPTPPVTPLYTGVWLLLMYLGWSMVTIPHLAWSGELSRGYHERSRVQAYFQTAKSVGALLVLALPAAMEWRGSVTQGEKVAAMGWFILITSVIATAMLFFSTREAPPGPPPPRVGFLRAGAAIFRNGPLLRVLLSDFFITLGQYIHGALFVFFVSAYMGLGHYAAGLFLVQFLFGVFASPLWLRISYRLGGKHRTVIAGELAQVAINLALLALAPGQFGALLALIVAQGLAQGSGNLMLRAMVSDIADDTRSGGAGHGVLFSVFSLSEKAATAVAVGVTFPLLALAGFHPGQHNAAPALTSLQIIYAVGPALAHAAAALCVWRFSDRFGQPRAAAHG